MARAERLTAAIASRGAVERSATAPTDAPDWSRTLRELSGPRGTPLVVVPPPVLPVAPAGSPLKATTASLGASARLRATTTPAASLTYAGLDAVGGGFAPKQYAAAAGAPAGHAGTAYTMLDTMGSAAEAHAAKAALSFATASLAMAAPIDARRAPVLSPMKPAPPPPAAAATAAAPSATKASAPPLPPPSASAARVLHPHNMPAGAPRSTPVPAAPGTPTGSLSDARTAILRDALRAHADRTASQATRLAGQRAAAAASAATVAGVWSRLHTR